MLRKVVVAAALGLLPIAATLPATPASANGEDPQPTISVAVTPGQVATNEIVTVAGVLLDGEQDPIAEAEIDLTHTSNSRDEAPVSCEEPEVGIGQDQKQKDGGEEKQEPAGCVTDANGRFTAQVKTDDPGAHKFIARYTIPAEEPEPEPEPSPEPSPEPEAQEEEESEVIEAEAIAYAFPKVPGSPDGNLQLDTATFNLSGPMEVKVSGDGFENGTEWGLWVSSDPIFLTGDTITANGFEVDVTLPSSLTPGSHTLVAIGREQNSTVTRILTSEIVVNAAPTPSTSTSASTSTATSTSSTLPVTGGSATPIILTSGALMVLTGAGMYLFAARRRRLASTA